MEFEVSKLEYKLKYQIGLLNEIEQTITTQKFP